MDRLNLQRLRDLPIEGVAERLGLRVTHGHKSICPFHDDSHPSLSFNLRKNTCRCFVCMNESIGTIDLVMRYLNKDFREACKWLANEDPSLTLPQGEGIRSYQKAPKPFDASRYERFFLRPWLSPEACHFLYDERRLDPRVIRWCRITSWTDRNGTNWLQTPYYDMDGQLIGIQNRNLQKGALPRFRFPQGSRCSIYNLPVLKMLRPGEELWITEGCSDCWAMLSAGHKAIAIPSATLLKPQDVEILSTLNSQLSTPFHMYPDKDEPGERLFMQLQKLLPDLEHHQLPPGCKDFSDYYVSSGGNNKTTKQQNHQTTKPPKQ